MASTTDTTAAPEIRLNKHRIDYSEWLAAGIFVLPFVAIYAVLFIYPTVQMILLSLQDAPLIGAGKWNGIDNYIRLFKDRLFSVAVWNTVYFVLLSVIPSTILGLLIALGVNRLKGWAQSVILACFFLPNILPVSVVCHKPFVVTIQPRFSVRKNSETGVSSMLVSCQCAPLSDVRTATCF